MLLDFIFFFKNKSIKKIRSACNYVMYQRNGIKFWLESIRSDAHQVELNYSSLMNGKLLCFVV